MPAADRRAALAKRVRDLPADGYLVSNPVNVRYLSGFTGSNGALLVPADGAAVLATDGRYLTQAAAEVAGLEVAEARGVTVALVERAQRAGLRRLAVEHAHLTMSAFATLSAAAEGRVELVDGMGAVEALRVVKDPEEITALRRACAITDEVFLHVLAQLQPGSTERDVAWWLRSAMWVRGADPAFDSIVAFGEHSAIPHHQPTDRPLRAGDLVKLDFGAAVDGYHADMTRTVVCGTAARWQREVHALVRGIQRASREATGPGAVPAQLDQHAREQLEAAGQQAMHGLGHGVGLQIHEDPFLTPGSAAEPLVAGVPVTVEPGAYLPGRGGVRIEDTVVVTTTGCEPLTRSSRELVEI